MALILPHEVYPIWSDIHHPNEPKVAEINQLLQHMTPAQRKITVSRAKKLADYYKAIGDAAAKMK